MLAALGAYNLIQNLFLPSWAYVPGNLVAMAGVLRIARDSGCTWSDLGLRRRHVRAGASWGLTGAVATFATTAALSRAATTAPYFRDERAHGHSRGQQTYRALVRFPLGTALFEEVAFRGVVYGLWRRAGHSRRAATLASAIAFGLWHVIPAHRALAGNVINDRVKRRMDAGAVVAAGVLSTTVAGWGLAWLRERSGSLVAPWIVHAAFNSIGYLAGVAAWRRVGR